MWHVGGVERQVVGIVENPQSLLDEFALVAPGQVTDPTGVTALFDAGGVPPGSIGRQCADSGIGGTVESVQPRDDLACRTGARHVAHRPRLDRRLHRAGAAALAVDRDARVDSVPRTAMSRLVVSANGAVVGFVGAILGFVLGLVALACLSPEPRAERAPRHRNVCALPWTVVVAAMVLAVVAAYFAASRPARAMTKVPIVQALSGRPAPPRQIHRSAVPGIVLLVLAFLMLGYSGSTNNGNGSGGAPELLFGIVLLIPGLILLAPFFLSLTARLGRRAPIAPRIALRDLARYRARSGSALAAISLGVLVAVIVILAASSRYGNVLDYAGPNLSSNQLWLSASEPPPGQPIVQRNAQGRLVPVKNQPVETATPPQLAASAKKIAKGLGAQLIALESPSAGMVSSDNQGGRSWNGQIYVATPQLLRAFGITTSEIDPNADILSSRPGLSGVSGLGLDLASGNSGAQSQTCTVVAGCVANPVIQEIGALPTGTSAPNTVITEHAMRKFHIQASTGDWLVQGSHPFTAAQISSAELTASTTQLSVESKNDQPSSSEVINWATVFGILIALGVLGMSVGLVRSETASELRTLTATGASSCTRRTLTAVTAGALGLSRGAPRGGGRLHRHDRLAAEQLAERGNRRAGERSCRRPPPDPARHAGIRGDHRLAACRSRAFQPCPAADGMTA